MFFYQDKYTQFIVVVTVPALCLNHLKFSKGFQTCQHTGKALHYLVRLGYKIEQRKQIEGA